MTAPSSAEGRGPWSARVGTLSVPVGLAVFGLATYGYLALAQRGLDAEAFAPLSVLWTLLNAVGIGLFLPFEQELGRTTASRRAAGEGNGAVVRSGLVGAGAVLLGVAVLAAVLGGVIADRLFAGAAALVPLLVLSLVGMAASYVTRGLLAGHGLFGRYGAQLAADGVLRVAGAGLLALAGVDGVAAYGLVLVASPVLAVLLTTPRWGRLVTPGPGHGLRVAARALTTLVAASLLSQALANAGPVVVQLLATPAESTASGEFTAALVVARVPLFAFAAVQAVLLPGLAALVGAGRLDAFRRRALLVLAVTGSLGLLGTAAVWVVGPPVVELLFPGFGVTREVITLIALSGAAFMVAQVLAQALLALGRDHAVLLGWAAGLVGLVAALVWTGPLELRAAWSLVAGAVVAAVVLGVWWLAAAREPAAGRGAAEARAPAAGGPAGPEVGS